MNNIDALRSMDIFAQVSEEDLLKIEALLREKKAGKNSIVFRQGEPGDALYIVKSGRIQCRTVDAARNERVLGFFSEGQFFGEMSLLTGEPHPNTMQAVADSSLLVLRKDDFDEYLAHNFPVMLQMMKVIAQRQAATSQRLAGDDALMDIPAGVGTVITVFSPKGGVGKSTMAVNLAVELAHSNPEEVVLLDLSLTFGHDLLMLNLVPKSSLAATSGEALKPMPMKGGLDYYLVQHPKSTLMVMPGATKPEDGELVTAGTVKAAITKLRGHFKWVIIDTGSNFTDPVLAALESSDKVIMLCSPEISALRDMRDCQRILNDVVHIQRSKIDYVMNTVFPFKALSKEQYETALQQQLYAEIPYGSDVPLKAALRGEAFVETQPGSNVAKSIRKLAEQITADTTKVGAFAGVHQEKKRGFFR